MSLSTNQLYFQQILLLSYSLVYAKRCQWNSSSAKQSLVHFCIMPFAMTYAFSPVFLYTMFPLARKFYKKQSFFFNVKSSLRGSKSLKCQEISPHLIKSSFTPNRIATVSYRLLLIRLENTFSDDARWNTIHKIFFKHPWFSFTCNEDKSSICTQVFWISNHMLLSTSIYTETHIYRLY